MQELKFTEGNLDKFNSGKCSTVRLGHPDSECGAVKLVSTESTNYVMSSITEITVCRLDDLKQRNAMSDGFKSVVELVSELEKCYSRSIDRKELITIVYFD